MLVNIAMIIRIVNMIMIRSLIAIMITSIVITIELKFKPSKPRALHHNPQVLMLRSRETAFVSLDLGRRSARLHWEGVVSCKRLGAVSAELPCSDRRLPCQFTSEAAQKYS